MVEVPFFTNMAFNVSQLTTTAVLNPNLAVILMAVGGLTATRSTSIPDPQGLFPALYHSDCFSAGGYPSHRRASAPDVAIARKVRARLPAAGLPSLATDDVGLLRVTPDFPEPMFDALAAQSLDLILPGLDKFPLNRCGVFESNKVSSKPIWSD